MERVALPPPRPLEISLSAALAAPHATPQLDRGRAIALDLLSRLLHYGGGHFGGRPLEVYVAARAVAAVPARLYHWEPSAHVLERLPVVEEELPSVYATLRDPRHKDAAAVMIVTAEPASVLARYGPRGYRVLLLETGALLQNFGLVASALGLGGSVVGTAGDTEIERCLNLDAELEIVIGGYAAGWPMPDAGGGAVPDRASGALEPEPERPARRPFSVAFTVPVGALTDLPLWPAGEEPPGLRALRGAEQVLGVRVSAELPAELRSVPPAVWPVYRRLTRLRQAGLSVQWHRIRLEADDPRMHACSAVVGRHGRGYGIDAFSPATAFAKTLGEAVERHVMLERALPANARVVRARARELDGRAVLPDAVAGYAPELRAQHADRLAWTDDSEFVWVEGTSLTDGGRIWVPLQLVARGVGPDGESLGLSREPELRPRVTTGLAAHPDRTSALLHALLEVVERDAFMLSWLSRLPGETLALDTTTDPELLSLRERFLGASLEPSAVALRTDVPVSVVLGIIRDPAGGGPAVAVGAAACRGMAEAATAALTEAFGAWRLTRRLVREGRPVPGDLSQLDHEGRLVWWAQPGRERALAWLLHGPCVPVAERRPTPPPTAQLDDVLAWFRQAGEPVIAVDLSDDALAGQLGHHVVRVVVPGFHPLHLCEDRPARWSRRLARWCERSDVPAPALLNSLPHPFP